MPIQVATSLIQGKQASIQLAEKAIQAAMKKAKLQQANGVFLIVSAHFSPILQETILMIAQYAQTTQVFGCIATGFFTEEDWVLDCPALAVMVLGGDLNISLAELTESNAPILTLAAASAVDTRKLNNNHPRYGGITGDATGQSKYVVWQNAKGVASGYVTQVFSGTKMVSQASHGFTFLGGPYQIQQSNGFDLDTIAQQPALQHLQNAWQAAHANAPLQLHRLMAVYANDLQAFSTGNFSQTSLISLNHQKNSVTLAHAIAPSTYLAWALREPKNAQTDLVRTTNQLLNDLQTPAAFCLMFSTIGRGPFEDGIDHDLNIVTHMLNHIPLLGFYGNGTIAYIGNENQLLPYSVGLNIFANI